MKAACPSCDKEKEIVLSDRDMLFTLQTCDACQLHFTQIVRNIKIENGKLTGEVISAEEMCKHNSNKGGEGDGKEKEQ